MNRVIRDRILPCSACLLWALVAGCNYAPPPSTAKPTGTYNAGAELYLSKKSGVSKRTTTASRDSVERAAILESSIKLIQGAALKPGGDNFGLATRKLNQYFEGTPRAEYQIEPEVRGFLATQMPPQLIALLENPEWSLKDARHLEDCMMYSIIASRVSGTGDDLTRVRRLFDWVTRNVQLVPAGSLGSQRLPQAFARPYDVLLRGMATEADGVWAERAWLFMALCRQIGIDSGLLTYTRGNVLEPLVPEASMAPAGGRPTKRPVVWITAVLIDDKAYLFDARVGLPISGPGGQGVATLDQTLADSSILERMDLPGQLPYETSRASLLASVGKLGVRIDSSSGYFAPKMKLLQRELAGKNRTVLHRSALEQRDHFRRALGDHAGAVGFWTLPLEVETRLFTDAQFVQSIQQSLVLFRPEFPLIYARVKQLRGELSEAIQEMVSFRFGDNVPLVTDKKRTIPRDIQEGLDVYATYFLALAHMERNADDQAELMFRQVLDILPEWGPKQLPFSMFRWGANANLGRLNEAKGDRRKAIAHYGQLDLTTQRHGNLLRARELVWADPMAAVPDPLPPASEGGSRIKITGAPAADNTRAAAPAQPTAPGR